MQVWNFDFLNATQGQVYGNASAAYETLLPQQNNSVYLGILVQASQNNIQPLNITINGQQCKLQLVNNITGQCAPSLCLSISAGADNSLGSVSGLRSSSLCEWARKFETSCPDCEVLHLTKMSRPEK